MKPTLCRLILILVLALGVAAAASAQEVKNQRLVVPLSNPGQPAVLDASLVQGKIRVYAYGGSEVIIETLPEERRRNGEEDSDDSDEDNENRGEPDRTGLRRIPNQSVGLTIEERNNRVEVSSESWNRWVSLVIHVPRKTSVRVDTVNGGDLEVAGVEGEHELQNTNGGITAIDVRGSVVANTTNGGIEVKLLDITPGKAMSFTTLNGNVDVTFPPKLAGVLLLNPGRGDVYTDFDVKLEPVSPEVVTSPKRKGYRVEMKQEVKAIVGAGGPEMHFRTFNGSIYLRKLK